MLLFDPRTRSKKNERGRMKMKRREEEEEEAHSRRRVDPSRGLVRYVTGGRRWEEGRGRVLPSNFSSLRQTNCPSCGETRGSPLSTGDPSPGPVVPFRRISYVHETAEKGSKYESRIGWWSRKKKKKKKKTDRNSIEGKRGRTSGKAREFSSISITLQTCFLARGSLIMFGK